MTLTEFVNILAEELESEGVTYEDLVRIDEEVKAEIMEIEEAPTIEQPTMNISEITYRDCTNTLLKMWMDDVLTDGEYRKIIDKLNAKERANNEVD